jgi:hypothetical protein
MAHPLQRSIGAVRRRARRLILLHALVSVAVVVSAAAVVLVLADWFLHFQDRGIRLLESAAFLALGGWAGFRFLLTALRAHYSDVTLALKIERRFPELEDRLASTMQFLAEREDDPQAGSATLRRAVIAETAATLEQLDLSQVIEPRPVRRALATAGGVATLAAVFVAISPNAARIGLVRLACPLGETAWPKTNHLAFVQPIERIAKGQAFEVEVIDTGGAPLPGEVFLHVRYLGDGRSPTEQAEPMRILGDAMVLRKENVTRPFAYRAVGGDDDSMPWTELEVVEPPAVEQLTLSLVYPDYTGWPVESSDPHIRALVGTRVELAATTTKPIRAAVLHVENAAAIPMRLSADRQGFALPGPDGERFVVEKSGSYWFELTDEDGFSSGQQVRYEIRAVDDLPPSVAIDEPAANVFVTAEAGVPLRIAANDDLAIRYVAFYYSRTDKTDEGEVATVLFEGPERVARRAGEGRASESELGESRQLEHRWELRTLQLKPGTQVTLFAAATDYKPQTGRSQPRRLSIITVDELQDRLAERQDFIFSELARILKLEQETRGQVAGLEIQWREVGRLAKQDVDHLQSAELSQRQVVRGLTSESEGVTAFIEGLLADMANNKVDSPDVERHLRALVDEIDRLNDGPLPAIDRALTAALKAGQEPTVGRSPLGESLAAAVAGQDEVVESLERMLGELSPWDNYRGFHREIGRLRREQEELKDETSDVGRETLTKDVKELDSQQQADLKKLASRQLDVARRFDRIQERMERAAGELDASEPLAAGTIADALHQARQRGVGSKMRAAARHVEENQVGQASEEQRALSEDLREVLDILANRREHELARLVKKLREAERQLDEMREQQEGLRKKWAEAAERPDGGAERRRELERLTRQQQELQAQTERFARTLARLQADEAGRAAGRGGSKMGQAAKQGQQGDSQTAADTARQAERDLEDAERQLAAERRQAESDLVQEQLARLDDGLRAIADQQRRLIDETEQYGGLREAQGELTPAQKRTVGDLARQEQLLAEETEGLAAQVPAEAFQLNLKLAARDMVRSGESLARAELGSASQEPQRRALARIEQLLEALKPDAGDESPPQEGDQQGGPGEGGPQSPGDAARALAELKLLKLMQDDLNRRTQALDDATGGRLPLTGEQLQALRDLSEEQGQLADLLLALSKAARDTPQDDAEQLPELKLNDEDERQ